MQRYERFNVVNKKFDPTPQQRQVLNILREQYQVNPGLIREHTGIDRQRINEALNALENAGWVENPVRGLYRLVYNGDCYVTQEIRCIDDE
jgi:DNA-binding MarR family transcriptional regulator